MNRPLWILIALLCGAVLPIQAGLNARLGKAFENPLYASLTSFLVDSAALIVYVLVSGQPVSFAGARSVPAVTWIGGVLGAFYVTAMVLAFPRLGPALTFGLVVAGQMAISLVLDHFNILVAQPHPINPWRIVGVAFVVIGVIIIRKF